MRARDLLYSANAQVRELESQQRKWARDKSLFNGIGKRLTMDQYKLILGLVHPDRHPGNEARAQLAFLAFKKLEKTVYTKQASRNEPSRNEEQEPSRNEASRNEAQAAIPAH